MFKMASNVLTWLSPSPPLIIPMCKLHIYYTIVAFSGGSRYCKKIPFLKGFKSWILLTLLVFVYSGHKGLYPLVHKFQAKRVRPYLLTCHYFSNALPRDYALVKFSRDFFCLIFILGEKNSNFIS
jgi:hypothetical protein